MVLFDKSGSFLSGKCSTCLGVPVPLRKNVPSSKKSIWQWKSGLLVTKIPENFAEVYLTIGIILVPEQVDLVQMIFLFSN